MTAYRTRGTGTIRKDGYVIITSGGIQRYEHVLVAEKVIGHQLPPGAEVHHVDENPSNNSNANLVVCENFAYHMFLHQRMRAVAAGFPASWVKCARCKQYDSRSNLQPHSKNAMVHVECKRRYERARRQRP